MTKDILIGRIESAILFLFIRVGLLNADGSLPS